MNAVRKLMLAAGFSAALVSSDIAQTQEPIVDLALVLAIDCSFSVDASEFRLQMQGLGQALQDEAVWEAIESGPNKRIAITAFQWSDSSNQATILPWTIIASQDSATDIGMRLETMTRQTAEGGTSITNALLFAEAILQKAPLSVRRVVDMSTDGRNNIGPPLPAARDRLLSNNIVINALVIINEFPNLEQYAEAQIIGGTDSFVVKAMTYDDYGAAILRKLVREITGPGTV